MKEGTKTSLGYFLLIKGVGFLGTSPIFILRIPSSPANQKFSNSNSNNKCSSRNQHGPPGTRATSAATGLLESPELNYLSWGKLHPC